MIPTQEDLEVCAEVHPNSQPKDKSTNCESFGLPGNSIQKIDLSYLSCMNAIFIDAQSTPPYQTLGRYIGACWAAKPEHESAAVRIVIWDDLLHGPSRSLTYSDVPMVRLAIAKAASQKNAFNLDEFWSQIPEVGFTEFYLGFVEGVAQWGLPGLPLSRTTCHKRRLVLPSPLPALR